MHANTFYREDFYLVDEFTAARTPNFADESACLTANNIRNEVVVENAVLSTRRYFSQLIVLLKKHGYTSPPCTYSTLDTSFHWMASAIVLPVLHYTLTLPVSSNFSSVSTRQLCFCFLAIKSPIVLSLFTKL
jgi:hypothetical protein